MTGTLKGGSAMRGRIRLTGGADFFSCHTRLHAIVPGESDILGLQASHRWLRGIAALRPMKFAGLAKTAHCEQTCFHTRRDP